MKCRITKKCGFTLIELLISVAIIGILMLLAIFRYADYTPGAKIRVFEVNSKTLISEINTSYMNNNRKIDNIYTDINKRAISLNGKPELSLDEVYKASGLLKCRLKKEAFNGTGDYIIEYDVTTQIITQKPKDNLPSGATKISK